MPTITCCVTGKTSEAKPGKGVEEKLPHGWKRFNDQHYSPEGFRSAFVPRGQTVPVSRALVIPSGKKTPALETLPWDDEDATREGWKEFRRCLAISWRQCAQVANWYVCQIARLDTDAITRENGKSKLPKLEYDRKALNNQARILYPELDSQSLYSIGRKAEAKYKEFRWAVRVEASKSIPTFRYPEPLPIESKDSPILLAGDEVLLVLRISGTRFAVRLKSDPVRFGRQLAPIRQAARDEIPRGAISVRDHDNGQVLITVAVSLPRQLVPRYREETFLIRTDPEALLVGELCGRREFILNEDELRRWSIVGKSDRESLKQMIGDHLDYIQRMSEDRKAESRAVRHWRNTQPPLVYGEEDEQLPSRERAKKRRQHRKNVLRALEARCEKHERRMTDRLHKIACVVVNHAARCGVCTVIYDDLVQTYLPKFPYYRLKTLVAEKLDYRGIKLVAKEEPKQPNSEIQVPPAA